MFFLRPNLLIYAQVFLTIICKAYCVALIFYILLLLFIVLFFIYSLKRFLLICKKIQKDQCQKSNNINAIDTCLTGSCGGTDRTLVDTVGGIANITAFTARIFLTFLASIKILSLNLFIYFSRPLHAFSCFLVSFVAFCRVLSLDHRILLQH